MDYNGTKQHDNEIVCPIKAIEPDSGHYLGLGDIGCNSRGSIGGNGVAVFFFET